jgi:rRNA maturation endonuclease Nob1
MKLVVDSSAIIEGFIPPGNCEIFIPSSVEQEIKEKTAHFLIYRSSFIIPNGSTSQVIWA